MKRLHENHVVTFGLPSTSFPSTHQTGDCVVIAISGKTAAVAALNPESWARIPEEIEDVYMTFSCENSLVSLKGLLTAANSGDHMRFMVTDDAHVRPDRPTRANVVLPVTVRPKGSSEEFETTTIDISTNGLRLKWERDVDPGSSLELDVGMPSTDKQVVFDRIVGAVVRSNRDEVVVTYSKEKTPLAFRMAIFELVAAARLEEWRRKNRPQAIQTEHDLV